MEHAWQYGANSAASAPSPANMQARTYLLDVMQRGLPGYPTDDRYLQTQKFTGIVYTAIRPLLEAMRKAEVVCMRRVRKRRNRTTFGPGGVVAKSVGAAGGKSQREDYVPVDADHPVARLIDRPQQKDGTETIGDVIEYGTLQVSLTGVAPYWCVPSRKYLDAGQWRPVQLYALPTVLTVPQAGRSLEYPAGYYRITPYYASPAGGAGWYQGLAGGAAGALLDGREVKRRMHKHPLYRWDGYSPLTACAFLLDVAEAVDQARWAQMQNGINTSLFLLANGMEAPSVAKFGQDLVQAKGGAQHNRQVVVVSTASENGKLDIKTPHQGQARLDYSDDWQQVQAAVLAVFRTPQTVAGLTTAPGHAELYAAKKQHFTDAVQPECERQGDFFTAALAQPWEEEDGELFIEVNTDEPRNEETHVISAKDLAEMDLVTVNQALASQNLPPVPDGNVPLSVYKQIVAKKAGLAPPEPVPGALAGGPPGKKPAPGDTPTGGAPPRPENPEAEGTKPPTGPRPTTKSMAAMNTLSDPAGGALVPPASVGGVRVVRGRKAVRRLLRAKQRRQP